MLATKLLVVFLINVPSPSVGLPHHGLPHDPHHGHHGHHSHNSHHSPDTDQLADKTDDSRILVTGPGTLVGDDEDIGNMSVENLLGG